jgi:hypothetical protein
VTSSDEFGLNVLVPGAIIERKVKSVWLPFAKHIGIYVNDEQVIHFNGERLFRRDFVVCAGTLSEFADGERVSVRDCPLDDDHSAAVVAEARRLLDSKENGFNGDYDFVNKNCEDFAAQCYEVKFPTARDPKIMRSEKASSSQRSTVARFAKITRKVGVVGGALVVGAVVLATNRQDRQSQG